MLSDEEVDDIPYVESSKYDWPPLQEGEEGFKHLDRFKVINNLNEFIDLFETGSDFNPEKKACRALGYLLPPPGSSLPEKLTQFPVTNYAIDFGADSNRGFWLTDKFGVWYKLENPAAEYAPSAEKVTRFCSEFFKLMDILTMGASGGTAYSVFDSNTNKYSCDKTIDFLSVATNGAFDIDVLMQDCELLYMRLQAAFTTKCEFMNSVKPVRATMTWMASPNCTDGPVTVR